MLWLLFAILQYVVVVKLLQIYINNRKTTNDSQLIIFIDIYGIYPRLTTLIIITSYVLILNLGLFLIWYRLHGTPFFCFFLFLFRYNLATAATAEYHCNQHYSQHLIIIVINIPIAYVIIISDNCAHTFIYAINYLIWHNGIDYK